MAIKEETVWIGLSSTSIEYWEEKDYEIPKTKNKKGKIIVKRETRIEVRVIDLPEYSHEKLTKICDICGEEGKEKIIYYGIIKSRKSGDGLDRCFKCGKYKSRKTKNKNLKIEESLFYKFPTISKEWHTTLNGELNPDKVSYGSHRVVWWFCPDCKSPYDMAIKIRTLGSHNCPFCRGMRVNYTNCLATTHPEKIKDWNYMLNGDKTPYNITYGHNGIVWWDCLNCGTPYDMNPTDKIIRNRNCPFCAGKKVNNTNSLSMIHPHLIDEWMFEKNGVITPSSVTSKSAKIVWWKCSNKECGYEWESAICDRSIGGGCRKCYFKNAVGENHPCYKHNITDEERILGRKYDNYYKWRTSVFERDDYTCQCCGYSKGSNLNAHHKDGYNWCLERRTDINNGVTLCEDCHADFHSVYGFGDNTEEQYDEWISEFLIECESIIKLKINIAM